ncbi:mitochondrial genome maintenance MGM101-domain-containing protein [Colletotrichum godetiae]|uniref:Mitochondrial genome maintenance protein MGM101 n=1 Tax=Colletotrichum godetiae TaxID=1209918 RepID=A0AAJ0EW00_9PEZI|nr:mitochondrial genome maintenance MGM101-domain-containing protein [Colletotrichum godetiae]KAK1675848.1 mitochondrial genome maintenance MGM101-domain-containing protein [Colletotrichum godetiae]
MRPLLRASRTATTTFTPIARIATTSRYKAASATTPASSPAKSAPASTSTYAKKTPAPAPKPSKPSSSSAAAASKATPAGPATTFPTAPPYVPPPQNQTADQTQQQQQQQTQQPIDWSTSYHGLGTARFPKEVVDILLQPVNPADVEVKPDGIVYLPEIKYRRILNQAFGPGGWGLVPKGDVVVGEKVVTREYALIAEGRFISQAQGENGYFSVESLPSAVEGCKSNALMRCCKDLGVASDLWDPVFIRQFRKEYADEIWAEHVTTKRKKLVWTRKDVPLAYPYKKTN